MTVRFHEFSQDSLVKNAYWSGVLLVMIGSSLEEFVLSPSPNPLIKLARNEGFSKAGESRKAIPRQKLGQKNIQNDLKPQLFKIFPFVGLAKEK